LKKIINKFKKIIEALPSHRKSQFWIILCGMICLSVLETIVLCCIAFFASVVSDIEKVRQSEYLNFVIDIFDWHWLADSTNLVIFTSILVVILVNIKNITQGIVNYWSIRFSSLIEGLFAGNLLSGFIDMPYEWHLSQNSADLILITANWRGYIGRRFVSNLLQIIADSLMVSIMLITLLVVQPLVSLIVITILGATSFFLFTSLRKKLDHVALMNSDFDQSINKQATKIIHGYKDVKISGKQDLFINQYTKSLYLVSKSYGYQQVIAKLPTWLLESVGFFMISFAICFMLFALNYSVARVSGTITLLAVTAWRVLPALNRILTYLATIRSTFPYVDKILNYYKDVQLNTIRNTSLSLSSEKEIAFKNTIRFESISFSYHNSQKYALHNINLTIRKGDVIGIIGASGAGKSTFIDLLTGLLLPSHGTIYIDDNVLDNVFSRSKWITRLGYVPQTPYIFDGTIAENVAFENDKNNINTDLVLKCCHMSAMDDFLKDLPSGINSYIGERGIRLSGGQRQRISIARTLYQKPELILFDEATSALDNENEKAIINTIFSLRGKQTMIIIAHRLSTVELCDVIYEFERGQLVNMGTPKEILNF